MAVTPTGNFDNPGEGICPGRDSVSRAASCPSASRQGACGRCAKVMEQLGQGSASDAPLPLGQGLLIFFLPLLCAAALVITAVRFLPKLAEHPGFLALSALGVACLVIFLAAIFTKRG